MKTNIAPQKRTFPWWGYVILAFAIYYGLKYGPIWIMSDGEQAIAGLLGQVAPIIAILLLLKGAAALYRGDEKEPDGEADPEE